MWKSLLQLFKPIELLPKEEIIWVKEKQKFNVKKAFATFRMKNGENVISRIIKGTVSTSETEYRIVSGREMFNSWIHTINSDRNPDYFLLIKEDRYVRVGDIMDIINVVESDHEIEVEVPIKKILRLKE